ncbi:MAG: hypothetical protein V3W06_04055, partial [Acidimicrobiia bacterium]
LSAGIAANTRPFGEITAQVPIPASGSRHQGRLLVIRGSNSMTTETNSHVITAAVYHAFHRADPCHCEGDAKLTRARSSSPR